MLAPRLVLVAALVLPACGDDENAKSDTAPPRVELPQHAFDAGVALYGHLHEFGISPVFPAGLELLVGDFEGGCGWYTDLDTQWLPSYLELRVENPDVGDCPIAGAWEHGASGPDGRCRAVVRAVRYFASGLRWDVEARPGGMVRIDAIDPGSVRGALIDATFPVTGLAQLCAPYDILDEQGNATETWYCTCTDYDGTETWCEATSARGCCNPEDAAVTRVDVPFAASWCEARDQPGFGGIENLAMPGQTCRSPVSEPDPAALECEALCAATRAVCADCATSFGCGPEPDPACLEALGCAAYGQERCVADCNRWKLEPIVNASLVCAGRTSTCGDWIRCAADACGFEPPAP